MNGTGKGQWHIAEEADGRGCSICSLWEILLFACRKSFLECLSFGWTQLLSRISINKSVPLTSVLKSGSNPTTCSSLLRAYFFLSCPDEEKRENVSRSFFYCKKVYHRHGLQTWSSPTCFVYSTPICELYYRNANLTNEQSTFFFILQICDLWIPRFGLCKY